MSELPGLSVVTDINDRGEILGLSDGRPVVWAHGIITPLLKTLTDGTACTNQVFGDPAPDVAKSCSLPLTGP